MKLTDTIRAKIMMWEGCKLRAYLCPAGVWTIGYGHTGPDVRPGMTITPQEAVRLFNADIDKFSAGVERLLGDVILTPHQFDAITSLAYNIGPGNLSKSTLLAKVKANPDDPTIRDEFMKHVFARVNGVLTPLRGLIRRRTEEANHYFS